ncbi:hypothetical protein V1525DRAFT_2687 [Lipomyces kononenkoae]|uniref:Uncharacterized protein n=1 Tax=Lipomyces kononenkoae TaxID=34357 RepID=A0ACC3TBE1_LIPKO
MSARANANLQVIDVSKLRSGLTVRNDLRAAAFGLQVSQHCLFGPCSETRNISARSVTESMRLHNAIRQSPLTRQVLPSQPSQYHQLQMHSKDGVDSSDEPNTIIGYSASLTGKEEDPVDTDGKDAAKFLSASHDLDLLPIAQSRHGRGSDAIKFANAEQHNISSENVQSPQVASAQAEQDKPDDDFLHSCVYSDQVAPSSDSSMQLSDGDVQCKSLELTDTSGLLLTDNETEEYESSNRLNGQFNDDGVLWPECEHKDYEHTEFCPSSPESDTASIEYNASPSDDQSTEDVSSIVDADDQNCEQSLSVTEDGEKSNNVYDEVSVDGDNSLGSSLVSFLAVVFDEDRMGETKVVNAGCRTIVPGDVIPTDTAMAASDEAFLPSEAPTAQAPAVSECQTIAAEQNYRDIDALWKHRIVSIPQIGQMPPRPVSRQSFRITQMNSKSQVLRQVELRDESTVLDFPLVTDDQLRDVEDVFCRSLRLLVTQYEKRSRQTDPVDGCGNLLVHVDSHTHDNPTAEPNQTAHGKPGASDEREDFIHSTNTSRTSWFPNSTVKALFLVTILIATLTICGWLSYVSIPLMYAF